MEEEKQSTDGPDTPKGSSASELRQIVVSAAFGSLGDLNPMLGLALELQKDKRNKVVMIVDGFFEEKVREAGVESIRTLGDKAEYEALLRDSERRDKTRMPTEVTNVLLSRLKPHYQLLERLEREAQPMLTVFVAHTAELATRIFQEKRGVPVVTVVLQPWILRSMIEPSQYEKMVQYRPWPKWLLRFGYWFVDQMVDGMYAKKINAVREELGLYAPVKGVYNKWFLSPALAIGLFPSWFANCADWPKQLRLADFPLFDHGAYTDDPAEALKHLPEGIRGFIEAAKSDKKKVVAVTLGSAPPSYAPKVFKAAVEATKKLDVRLIILHGNADEVVGAASLPSHAMHATYVPFSALLVSVDAIVHNGGVGTMSQALRAGIPQLIVPGRWDQPDNALRIKKLGLGKRMSASAACSQGALRGKLERLLSSHDVRLRCDEAAWQFRHARISAFGAEDGVLRPYGGIVRAAALVDAFAVEQAAATAALSDVAPLSSRQYKVELLDE